MKKLMLLLSLTIAWSCNQSPSRDNTTLASVTTRHPAGLTFTSARLTIKNASGETIFTKSEAMNALTMSTGEVLQPGNYHFSLEYLRGESIAYSSQFCRNGGSNSELRPIVAGSNPITILVCDSNMEPVPASLAIEPLIIRNDPCNLLAETFPATLSATACFSSMQPLTPDPAVTPYEVAAPFWSSGARKTRFLFIKQADKIAIENGRFVFPNGTVLIKNFYFPMLDNQVLVERLKETRLIVKRADGFQFASYRWRSDGSDADLVREGLTETIEIAINGQTVSLPHRYPQAAECKRCHLPGSRDVIGFEMEQLQREVSRDGVQINQLKVLASRFEPNLTSTSTAATLVDPYSNEAGLESRARSWLHTNCAFCHFPGSTQVEHIDFRISNRDLITQLCGTLPRNTIPLPNSRLIDPGNVETSLLLNRVNRTDTWQMPPVLTPIIDSQGYGVLRQWVQSMDRLCRQ